MRVGVYAPPPDIQDLIDAAAPGDTLRVPAWTYTGPRNRDLDFRGKNLVLLGAGKDGTIIDCEGLGRGFLFQTGEDSTAVVQGFTIRNAWAGLDSTGAERNGGGAGLSGASPTFRDCTFESCNAFNGGGIYATGGSSLRLESCRFDTQTASERGGGLYLSGAAATLQECSFDSCHAQEGGGLYGDIGSSIDLKECTFSSNTAVQDGGGLTAGGDTLHVGGCLFLNNVSDHGSGGGGFLYCPSTVDSCTFSGNAGIALYSGYSYQLWSPQPGSSIRLQGLAGSSTLSGAYYPIEITRCDFQDNSGSAVAGGGISIEGCTFVGNTGTNGGAVNANFVSVIGCLFTDNTAENRGGALFGFVVDYEDCTISGNQAGEGGGLFIGNGLVSWSHVSGCGITGNRATRGGGAAFWPGDDLVLFDHCTIAGNSAHLGGGIFVNEAAQPTIQHSILAVNCADSLGPTLFTESEISSADFVCSAVDSAGIAGSGAVTYTGPQVFTNPVFCGPVSCESAPTTDGDYRLAANSPCLPGASPCDSLIGALGEGCAIVGVPGGKPPVVTRPLLAAFPNPFTGSLRIQYAVPGMAPPRLSIYTIAGRLVRELRPAATSGIVTWDGRDADGAELPAGVYFVKMAGPAGGSVQRVVLLR